MPMQIRRSIEERFWAKVARSDGCWLWLAAKDGCGYGHFYPESRKLMKAHRMAWELLKGSIPDCLCVLHHCDNPSCVNPDHLFLGTKKDNTQDAIAKGRDKAWLDGGKAWWAKLSKAERIAVNKAKLESAWEAQARYWDGLTQEDRSAHARRGALARWSRPDTPRSQRASRIASRVT